MYRLGSLLHIGPDLGTALSGVPAQANLVHLAVEIDWHMFGAWPLVDNAFLLLFTLELALRVAAKGRQFFEELPPLPAAPLTAHGLEPRVPRPSHLCMRCCRTCPLGASAGGQGALIDA